MHLLNLTLQPPSAILHAVYGNFSQAKAQEVIVSRGQMLELLRPDDLGKLHSITRLDTYSVIRSLHAFRLTGSTKDYIVVGSDSGKISILEYMSNESFEIRHLETFGKTGCRRITAGEYLAVDPKGRAILIGAIEKQKLVYVMNRDASNRLTISSPLEAHRAHTIHYDIVGIDVGFENPIFASLELDYSDSDADPTGAAKDAADKILVYYELDLGLNHVTRRWASAVPRSAHKLIAVPGGADGPGGVLVCAHDCIVYKNEQHKDLTCSLPRRENVPDGNSIMIIASATHKQRDLFFMLIQTELGDLFKVSLQTEGEVVTELKVRLFDTIPIASNICITRTGFLFAASESANHYLFQFQGLGDDTDNAIEMTSQSSLATPVRFAPRAKMANLLKVDEMESIAPLTQFHISDYANEQTPQVYALSGRAERSSLRVLRHGLPVTEMAVSELPGQPMAVWCIKQHHADPFDKYIIVSFANATLVLSIGETVEEVTDTGLLLDVPTLLVVLLADDSIVQIHANGVRHIPSGRPVTEWKAPGKKRIEKCSANARQVILSLVGGELVYFELENSELVEKITTELGIEIACVKLGTVEKDRQRFPFLALAGWDNTVRILSLDPNDRMRQKSTLALSCPAESLCIHHTGATESGSGNQLLLNIGLHNGVFQRTEMDSITGTLSNTRSRFLGAQPVQLARLSTGILALSNRSWLSYSYQNAMNLTPLSYEMLTSASQFTSEQCTEGIVAVTKNTLRIITLERFDQIFNQQHVPLEYTPRRVSYHTPSGKLLLIESDHNAVKREPAVGSTAMDLEEDEDDSRPPVIKTDRVPEAKSNSWSSQLRLYDPIQQTTCTIVPMEDNVAAISLTTCVFHDRGGETFILVGCVKSLALHNRQPSTPPAAHVNVYRLIESSASFQLMLVHSTPLDGLPYAMCGFQGRVLISVNNILRIYDLGKRKLLRKCENKQLPTRITTIQTAGYRIYVGDLHESFHVLTYKPSENQLAIFADDTIPRHVTCMSVLDYDTIAGGDKFGNVFVLRLPAEASEEVENPAGNRILWDTGVLNGAPNKFEQIVQFHVGQVITSLTRTTLVAGGLECIVYGTILGTIGVLVPLTTRQDVEFYSQLEMFLRAEYASLTGRDHLTYRSYFIPVKNCTDGDLCQHYMNLSPETQQRIAKEMDRTPMEITKQFEDLRNLII